eukprot:scaffold406489_cov18-Prasinocladus_malaysianus.AAC.1
MASGLRIVHNISCRKQIKTQCTLIGKLNDKRCSDVWGWELAGDGSFQPYRLPAALDPLAAVLRQAEHVLTEVWRKQLVSLRANNKKASKKKP